jgi:hypothetical protein
MLVVVTAESRPRRRVLDAVLPEPLRRFATVERILGGVLVLTPVVLIATDGWKIRDSISAYHDVGWPAAFYVPLTIAAMLFLVNGILRDEHGYNIWLGAALGGVIVFDHEDWTILHFACAIAFFGGNIVVMALFSTNKSTRVKAGLAAGIVIAAALWYLTSLFWAEWVSLAIIATHYILDSVSWSTSPYKALKPGEKPKLTPSRAP